MINCSPGRRSRLRRVQVGLAAGGTAALVAATGVPATATAATPETSLNRAVPVAADTYVDPVASTTDVSAFGSRWAVFERHNAVGRALDPTGQLIAVTAEGKRQVFGQVTPDMSDFSLSGHTLTASSGRDASRVYWWQPRSGATRGAYSAGLVAGDDRYLSSAPDGWVEVDPAGMLHDIAVGSGASRTLGNPFATAADVSGVSGPTGIVVWNASKIDFVSFATGAVTPLDVSNLTNLPGGANTPRCWSVSSSAVACGSYYDTGEDNSGLRNVFVDPLDGSPSYAVSTACPAAATMQGGNAGWLSCKGKLRVIGKGATAVSPRTIATAPLAGLGGYLTTSASRHAGRLVSADAKRSTTVLAATHDESEATAFSLTNGTIMWIENDSSTAPAAVHRRSIAPHDFGQGTTTGKSHEVSVSRALRGGIAAVGDTIAYPTTLTNSSVGENGGETLRVVAPTRSATITGVDRYLPIGLGDHRVVYYTDSTHVRILNLRTRTTQALSVTGAAISGHWLAYGDSAGTIRLKNLDTGVARTVRTNVDLVEDELFVHDQVVGWNAYAAGTTHRLGFYRDMAQGTGTNELPTADNVWQLSDAGIVLEHKAGNGADGAPSFPGPRSLRFHPNMSFTLRPYDSGADNPLPIIANYAIAGPQVAAGIVAWIDQHGRLRASALS